jgi:hypothetical protein
MGVADVLFIKDQLYALLAGSGCSHGNPDVPNALIKVMENGTWKIVANLSAFQQAHPVANAPVEDFEPDGTWYSMTNVSNSIYAVEPNHSEVDRIDPNGKITRIIDVSATSQTWVGPTSIDYYGGNFYLGNLTPYPLVQGAASTFKLTPDGKLSTQFTGLTNILGTLYGRDGDLYVLESNVGVQFPTPGTGQIVRITPYGIIQPVTSGLTFPSAMTFGPDGNLYVSNFGYDYPAGQGQIVRVVVR